MPDMSKSRAFLIVRDEDPTGVSGTGIVAEGFQFHDGQVAISWFGNHQILEVTSSIKRWLFVHGHQGRTRVEWLERPRPQVRHRATPRSGQTRRQS